MVGRRGSSRVRVQALGRPSTPEITDERSPPLRSTCDLCRTPALSSAACFGRSNSGPSKALWGDVDMAREGHAEGAGEFIADATCVFGDRRLPLPRTDQGRCAQGRPRLRGTRTLVHLPSITAS